MAVATATASRNMAGRKGGTVPVSVLAVNAEDIGRFRALHVAERDILLVNTAVAVGRRNGCLDATCVTARAASPVANAAMEP